MAKDILAIVETAYRATLEEQDDPVLWLFATLARNGAGVSVLLQGNAVNYATTGQDASGLAFGDRGQTRPPRLEKSLDDLVAQGANVFYVAEDAESHGLAQSDFTTSARGVPRAAIAGLVAEHPRVWRW